MYVECSSRSYKMHTSKHGVVSVTCIIYGLIWLLMWEDCGNCLDWYLWSILLQETKELQSSCVPVGRNALNFSRSGENKEYNEFHLWVTRASLVQIRWKFLSEQIVFLHKKWALWSETWSSQASQGWNWGFRDGLCAFVLCGICSGVVRLQSCSQVIKPQPLNAPNTSVLSQECPQPPCN